MREQIAKDLAESGLFDWLTDEGFEYWWPNADTSEAILAEMGLQVIAQGEDVELFQDLKLCAVTMAYEFNGNHICTLEVGAKEKISVKLNAALAWLSKQAEWIDKLKAAIETVKNKERR
jgi:hypothetical protein